MKIPALVKKAITPTLIMALFLFFLSAGSAQSTPWEEGLQWAGDVSELPKTDSKDLVSNFLLWLLRIFIILSFISFVVNGILYLIAATTRDADRAKKGTLFSILAVAIALSSYIIISLIDQLLSKK